MPFQLRLTPTLSGQPADLAGAHSPHLDAGTWAGQRLGSRVPFRACYDCGCSGEEGDCWNAGEAVLEVSPVHAQTGRQADPPGTLPRPRFLQRLLRADPVARRSCGGQVLALGSVLASTSGEKNRRERERDSGLQRDPDRQGLAKGQRVPAASPVRWLLWLVSPLLR